MKISSPPAFLGRIDTKWYFLLLFLFQVVFTFQGIDLSDSGFYGTFYQNIYRAPETVQYNFMFWFSGIVGGFVNWLVPGMGLLGFRLAGVIVTTSTALVAYKLLRPYVNQANLKLGLLLVLLFINNNLKEVHYNDLSALLNMLAIYFLFKGLTGDSQLRVFVAGMFVSLSSFTRLPNVLCLGLGLGIFIFGYYHRHAIQKQIIRLLIFGAGFVLCSALILLVMKVAGHLEIFLNTLQLLSEMGSGGEESFYGPVVLIRNFVNTYAAALKYTVMIGAALLAGIILTNLAASLPWYRKWMAVAARYLLILAACVLFVLGFLDRDKLLYFFTGLVLVTTLLVLFGRNNKELKLLALMGCYILITFPFSSSAGLFTVGIYSMWLSLPIAIDYLFRLKAASGQLAFERSAGTERYLFAVSPGQVRNAVNSITVVCLFGCLVYTWRYPFFDRHERLKMTSGIDNKYLRGILTTPERATALNELLRQIPNYIKPGDYLMAYQTVPMLNYITDTRPFMRNSYPWLYDAKTFRTELYKGVEETKTLPVIIRQKIKTIGASSNWPDPSPEDLSEYEQKNAERDRYLEEFLASNQYRQAWSSEYFSIFVPGR